jgi:hypothetical protein
MRGHLLAFAVCACIGLCGAACNFGSVTPAPTDPNAPTGPVPPATPPSETFSGTLAVPSDTVFHNFTVTQSGTVDVTLSALTPSTPKPGAQVLVGLGTPTPDGARCSFSNVLVKFVQAGPNLVLPEVPLSPGTYCVGVEDQFRIAPFTYTLNVWHK